MVETLTSVTRPASRQLAASVGFAPHGGGGRTCEMVASAFAMGRGVRVLQSGPTRQTLVGGAEREMANPDPITLELFKNAIFSIADEMALTVFRTTYSGVLKD